MAGSKTAEDADIVAMSEELNIDERGARNQGGRGRGKGRAGRGGRSDGGKWGGRGEMNREVAVSKALSKLLRHAAEDEGLALDGEGFARLDQVVSFPLLIAIKLASNPLLGTKSPPFINHVIFTFFWR